MVKPIDVQGQMDSILNQMNNKRIELLINGKDWCYWTYFPGTVYPDPRYKDCTFNSYCTNNKILTIKYDKIFISNYNTNGFYIN